MSINGPFLVRPAVPRGIYKQETGARFPVRSHSHPAAFKISTRCVDRFSAMSLRSTSSGLEDAQRRTESATGNAGHGRILVVAGREILLRLVRGEVFEERDRVLAVRRIRRHAAARDVHMRADVVLVREDPADVVELRPSIRSLDRCAARERSSRCSTWRCRTRPRRCRAAGRCRRPAGRARSCRRRPVAQSCTASSPQMRDQGGQHVLR
jgi:hypothetical protein